MFGPRVATFPIPLWNVLTVLVNDAFSIVVGAPYELVPVGSDPSRLVKIPLTVVPIPEIAASDKTIIRANMTAYSVAVGPSSDFKKLMARFRKWFILGSPLNRRLPTYTLGSTGGLRIPDRADRLVHPSLIARS